MIIIGDIHCKVDQYFQLIKNEQSSLQVGDFGFKEEHDWHLENVSNHHRVNFGNHDYYPYLNKPHSCGNFSYDGTIFTIRGAHSIDRHKRLESVDWFENEELNAVEQLEVLDAYLLHKPEIVIAHDAPMFVTTELFGFPKPMDIDYLKYKSQTRALLEHLVKEHPPKIFIFGHFHKSKDEVIEGTRYICLKELETFNL